MSSHLKVELQKLKRSLDGGYGFDLTRFCAGCWNRLGRILRRGLCCDSCGKRVCKTCRHFLDEKNWICVLCYKKKFSREAWWHDDANVQRFKGSQGKNGTYLLRLTDWSSHGLLDALAANDTLGRRIHSFSEESVFSIQRGIPITFRNLKSKSEILSGSYAQEQISHQLTSQIGWNWNQKWRLLTQTNYDVGKENSLQYTSTTLKQKRREIRELSRMSQSHELSHEVRKSRRRRRNPSSHSKNHQSSNKQESHLDPEESDPKIMDNCSNSCLSNIRKRIRELDCNNFQPEVKRNDLHTRMSVRGTRVFGSRKKSSRAYVEGHMRGTSSAIPFADLKCKSFSLPSELQHADCQDYDFWNTGFVQSRVRRLEEDLATSKWDDRYNYDFEVQSLCSLELGRILPDSDDYRIAYLSSLGTSLESSLDYIDDSISAFGMGTLDLKVDKKLDNEFRMNRQVDCSTGMSTLDVRLRNKEMMEERNEDDWDMSLSSFEENIDSSSSDEEFEFSRVRGVNVIHETQTYEQHESNSHENPETFNEIKSDILETNQDTKNFSGCADYVYNEHCHTTETKLEDEFTLIPVNEINVCPEAQTHQCNKHENTETSNEIGSTVLKKNWNSITTVSSNINYISNVLHKALEIPLDSSMNCQDFESELPSIISETQPYQSNENEENCMTGNSFSTEIGNIDQIEFPKNVTRSRRSHIANEISHPRLRSSNRSLNTEFNLPNSNYSKARVSLKDTKFKSNNLGPSKKKGWRQDHKFPVADKSFVKLTELFDYEPLSTPFAEIYAISCGKKLNDSTLSDSTIESLQEFSGSDTEKDYSTQNSITDQTNSMISATGRSKHYSCTVPSNYLVLDHPILKTNEMSFRQYDLTISKPTKDYQMIYKDNIEHNDDKILILPEKIYESSVDTKYLLSSILEINKIDIFRTLKNEITYIPLRGTSLEFLPLFWNGRIGGINYFIDHDFNFKASPKHLPLYILDKKSFLKMSLIGNENSRQNILNSNYVKNLNMSHIRYVNKYVKVFKESFDFQSAPSDHRKANSWSYFVDSNNRITEIDLIPEEFFLFQEENNYFDTYNHSSTDAALIFYNFCLNKKIIIPDVYLLDLLANDNTEFQGLNKLKKKQQDSNLHMLMKQLPLIKPHLRNRNYVIKSNLCRNETEVVNQVTAAVAGKISESRFANSRQRFVTSRTGRAAFAEYPFPFSQSQSAHECNQVRLISGSVTVPAVQRVAERESCCSASQWAVCLTKADGADHAATDQNNQKSCCVARNGFEECCSVILDYTETDSLDYYNYGDYFERSGYLPNSPALLIVAAAGDCANPYNGTSACCGTRFRRNMANCDGEPRSLGKHVRTQGKNISKLMRLFDTGDQSDCDNTASNAVECRTRNGFTQQRPKDTSEICVETCGMTIPSADNSLPGLMGSEVNKNVLIPKEEIKLENSSTIPYCRKVQNSGLWENVNIGATNDNNGLWNTAQNHNQTQESDQVSNLVSSTAELHNLIAVSKAELSKKKEPSHSDKSNLETYFTSFENSKSNYSQKSSTLDNSFHSPYDCDINEMSFDDEEAMLSDTSSEEDLRCHTAMTNTNYLPAYALHTIIEESCEESERDSRTTTPTNEANTSKLERYFSWDIINDAEANLRKKADDQSTIYSDSLSESSGSLVGEDIKEIDPTHLASSRLEKYFTSGLVDDQNYFYPDDAEFLDDAPVSDFEEDSIHQKISRSALLSSLEVMPTSNHTCVDIKESRLPDLQNSESPFQYDENYVGTAAKSDVNCDKIDESAESKQSENTQSLTMCLESTICSENIDLELKNNENCVIEKEAKSTSDSKDSVSAESESIATHSDLVIDIKISENVSNEIILDDTTNKNSELCTQKPVVNKDQLAVDIQAIIKKLLSYFTSETGSESFKENIETDYISAWQILETEIERLLQSISPNALENNSCNSSTIDSNNSDYGSDTIESMDCMTDEDDNTDAKSRVNTKCPLVDMLSSSYKIQAESDLSNFNISEETLNIWKRLIQSLQRDNSVLSENKVCDPTAEARLYIRDQIVTLMHTVTVNDSLPETEKPIDIFQTQNQEIPHSLIEENEDSEKINEAFNVSLNNSDILSHLPGNDILDEVARASKAESSDEGISSDSAENIHSDVLVLEQNDPVAPDIFRVDCLSAPPGDMDSVKIVCDAISNTEKISDSFHVSNSEHDRNNSSEINHKPKNKHALNREAPNKENELKFSVFVDIELGDDNTIVTECRQSKSKTGETLPGLPESKETLTKNCESKSSLQEEAEIFTVPFPFGINNVVEDSLVSSKPNKTSRDTGYYSFKSSDDSLLNTSSPSMEIVDVPNFKSLKRTMKKFPLSNTLSKSSNNILQTFSTTDAKFSTLQLKSKKCKSSSVAAGSSPKFSSLFSPSAVLKRFTGSKSNEAPNPETSIPPKYLKKYARSVSMDNESLFGAVSMPVLNTPRPGDSYSALGLYSENDRDSSLTLDDEAEAKRYFSGSQSVLSLGAHSASMTSVYSAAGCHYGYVTVSGDVLFGLNYNQKSQMMEVFVKQCRNLAATDVRHNKSNPYVKVYLLPDKTRSGKRKSKTKKNTVNPVFNELLRFPVLKNELESRTLWLSVWNSDFFGRNDFLGEILLPLGYRLLDSPTLRWYPLQERVESLTSPLNYRGELFLALKYVPRDLSLESRFRPAPVISLRGALHVLVKEARNITINRSSGTLDAFCKSYLLPDKSKGTKQKTPVVRKSGHPKWYYTVIYEDLSPEELKERSLELTVWDHDKLASNHFMGGVRLNTGSGLYHGISVDWMDSRRDESSLWQAMLDSPNMWVDGCLPLRPTMQFHNS